MLEKSLKNSIEFENHRKEFYERIALYEKSLENIKNDISVIFPAKAASLLTKKEQEYFNKIKKSDLIEVLCRGMNTHDQASRELKDFVDVLMRGETLQIYG